MVTCHDGTCPDVHISLKKARLCKPVNYWYHWNSQFSFSVSSFGGQKFFLVGVVESISLGSWGVGWGVIILLCHIGPVYNTAVKANNNFKSFWCKKIQKDRH